VSPNSLSYLLTFGFLALFVTGCGGDTSKPSNSASPSTSASPSVSAAASPAPVASAAPSFSTPVVPGAKDSSESPIPEVSPNSESLSALLPASNSDTVVRNTNKGRIDPFATISAPTTVVTKAVPRVAVSNGSGAVNNMPANSGNSGSNGSVRPRVSSGLGLASAAASAGKRSNSNASNLAVRPRPIPGALDSAPDKPGRSVKPGVPATGGSRPNPLVPIDPDQVAIRNVPSPEASVAPRPMYASNVLVSGVAQVNGQTQVILKLPNESFSRYVSVGERVMDGKVLVKRVENPNSMTPIVVLEEVGTEVPRKVGEKVDAPAKEGTR
jgi:hypothetical protein